MAKQELIQGLKNAIERGETTEKAMMSFYNAGYGKKDIEDAAKIVMMDKFEKKPKKSASSYKEDTIKKKKPVKKDLIKKKKENKKVSEYNEIEDKGNLKNKLTNYILIILIGIIILIVLSVLSLVLIFRKEFINFFNNLFFLIF